MTGELSKILDSVEQIGRLDLDDVPPTTHVVEVANALRPDEPRPSLPREVALAQAPVVADGGFLAPTPQAWMARTADRPAAEAVAAVRRGDVGAAEVFAAYRDRAAADELNAYLWVADGPPEDGGAAGRPLAGVPLGVKDLFCTK